MSDELDNRQGFVCSQYTSSRVWSLYVSLREMANIGPLAWQTIIGSPSNYWSTNAQNHICFYNHICCGHLEGVGP